MINNFVISQELPAFCNKRFICSENSNIPPLAPRLSERAANRAYSPTLPACSTQRCRHADIEFPEIDRAWA